MELMQARRRLLTIRHSSDLYPIGTDVVTMYIGRDASGYGNFVTGKQLNNNGEISDGAANAASPVYIPVKDTYRYAKNDNRLYNLSYYDSDYRFIAYKSYVSLIAMDLDPFPAGTAYIRIATHPTSKGNWRISVTRIA